MDDALFKHATICCLVALVAVLSIGNGVFIFMILAAVDHG